MYHTYSMSYVFSVFDFLQNLFNSIVQSILFDLGLNRGVVSSYIATLGIIIVGILTSIIITMLIVDMVNGVKIRQHFEIGKYDRLSEGMLGKVVGIITLFCSIWFLFAVLYIFFSI